MGPRHPAVPDWEITFMERLQAAGYVTGAAGKIHMVKAKGYDWMRLTGGKSARWRQPVDPALGPAGIGQEYGRWLEARNPGALERMFRQRQAPDYVTFRKAIANVLPVEHYIETWIAENAIEFVRRHGSPSAHRSPPGVDGIAAEQTRQPFFLWIGFCGPHTPYDPPEPYASLYRIDDVPLPRRFGEVPAGRPPLHAPDEPCGRSPETDHVARRVVAHYWALNRLIDDKIGEILGELRRRRLLDETLILYTTDHGDMLMDCDGMWGKGNFYEPVIRAPLIVKPPAAAVRPLPRFDGLVENMDIAPTALDYAGVEIPRQMQAASLRPIIEGRGGGKESILCEFVSDDDGIRGKCLRTERFKYAFWGRDLMGEFYDLEADPDEMVNLIDQPSLQAEVSRHQILLLEKLSRSERFYRIEHPRQKGPGQE
jgi:arylsulfatase